MDIVNALSAKHYTRLRKYWQAGRNGLSSSGDGLALDLTAIGYLEMKASGGGLLLTITSAGIVALQLDLELERARRRPHHDLASRLSGWLREQRRITWENIELMVPLTDGKRRAARPDVFSLMTTYDEVRINPCIHEVKVSRSDFLADVARPDKRAAYGQLAEQVYYAAPAGMIRAAEVPDGCGLVEEVGFGIFKVEKRPKKRRVELTAHQFMNLILKPGSIPLVL